MNHIKLIEKGTTVYVYQIDERGEQVNIFEPVLGKDILKSPDDYVDYNGSLIVSEQEVADAVNKYMEEEHPEVFEFMFEVSEW